MNLLKIINKKNFPNYNFLKFDNGTYTNKDIILLNKDFNILYKIDSNFKVTLYKPEIKIYKICYDESENCYWALMEFDNKIYKLNENLKKIACISLNYPIDLLNEICDISYCKNYDLFVITTNKCIFKFDKNGQCKEKIYENNSKKVYCSSYCFCNYTYILYNENKNTYISILMNDKEVHLYKIPYAFSNFSIVYIEKDKENEGEIITLIAKDDKSNETCLISLCPNYNNSPMPYFKENLDNEDMIGSIILVENSLAHILDLESEKLKKGINLASTVEEMLNLNENLTETIINITQLEYLLTNRLKSLQKFK